MPNPQNNHFITLDGLRGVAALTVAAGHMNETFMIWSNHSRIQLSVDFFFMLSGFVMGHAYENRLKNGLYLSEFSIIRLIRLYPLVFFGVTIGAISRFIDGAAGNGIIAIFGAAFFAYLMLPLPRIGSTQDVSAFPLNGPLWSLTYEILSNIIYASVAQILSTPKLAIFTIIMGTLLAIYCYNYDGVSANVGWNIGLLWGIPRVFTPFSIGILIFRCKNSHSPKNIPKLGAIGAIGTGLLLSTVLWFPIGKSFYYDFIAIVIAFPCIIWLALECRNTTWLQAFWTWLGALSYPIYALNQPIYRICKATALKLQILPEFVLAVGIGSAILSVVLSQIVLNKYDIPLRVWLNQMRKTHATRLKTAVGE